MADYEFPQEPPRAKRLLMRSRRRKAMFDHLTRRRSTAWWILSISLAIPTFASAAPWFLAGDADSSETLDVSAPVRVLQYLFSSPGEASISCLEAADANDSGEIDLGDAVVLLNYLFLRGRPPARAH